MFGDGEDGKVISVVQKGYMLGGRVLRPAMVVVGEQRQGKTSKVNAMPIFGGSKRPKLDGLTKEEEQRRDALNPEVLRRAGEKGVAGQAPAALGVLREKDEAEPRRLSLAAAPGLADDEHAPLWPGDRGLQRGDRSATRRSPRLLRRRERLLRGGRGEAQPRRTAPTDEFGAGRA